MARLGELVNVLEAGNTAQYPANHQPGMAVPKGGSSCTSCKFLADNKTDCTNEYFQKWHGSPVIPGPIDSYCSDWYIPSAAAKKKMGSE